MHRVHHGKHRNLQRGSSCLGSQCSCAGQRWGCHCDRNRDVFGNWLRNVFGDWIIGAAPFVAGLWLLQGTVPALPESGCPRLKKPKSHPVQQKLKNMKARQLHGTQVRAQETKGPIDKSARQ